MKTFIIGLQRFLIVGGIVIMTTILSYLAGKFGLLGKLINFIKEKIGK